MAKNIGSGWLPRNVEKLLIDPERPLLVACSGGADSVFLFLAIQGWLEARNELSRLKILHFNHRLRGEESEGDEDFVRKLAEQLDVPLSVSRWNRENPAESVSEDQARQARMDFFAIEVASKSGEAIILTAHHADDVAETMLMRLSRGSGLQGLSAPRSFSVGYKGLHFARPLVDWRKNEMIDLLKRCGATWREDSSNRESCFYRNRLRLEVIPAWESVSDRPIQPGVSLSRELLEEDSIALEEQFEKAWEKCLLEPGRLDFNSVRSEPKAIQRRTLQRLCTQSANSLGIALEGMRAALEATEMGESLKLSLGPGFSLLVDPDRNQIRILDSERADINWDSLSLPLNTFAWLPDGSRAAAEVLDLDSSLKAEVLQGKISHANQVFLRLDGEKGMDRVRIRQWEFGDAYQPYGKMGPKKLKELFTDCKIAKEKRHALPIFLGSKSEIIWVPGLPPNSEFIINEGTRRALQLTYQEGACTFSA